MPLARDAVRRQPGNVFALEQNAPGGRRQDTGQTVEKRALAGAVRADDGADLIATDREIDVVQRGQPPEADRQRLGAQDRLGASRVAPPRCAPSHVAPLGRRAAAGPLSALT